MRLLTRPIALVTGITAIALAGIAVAILPRLLSGPETLTAMFTAPMLVLRAVAPGQVTNVAVSIGQPVDENTPLLTVHVSALPDTALNDLKARLAQARVRQSGLDDPSATPASRRQAAAEVDRLQRELAVTDGNAPSDQPIVAGVHGIVWSLDAQAGERLQAGDPLAQLADCGRAFLVLRDGASGLKAGHNVLIRMAGLRPFRGVVRPSAGVAEPANTMVVDPTGFAAVAPNACPVGSSAEIQPDKG
jgi:biotin carboxyl carrier protein